MRGTRLGSVFLLICFSLLFCTDSFAESSREGWAISPMAGVYIFDDAPQDFDDGPVVGVRLAYLFLDHWGVEGQLDYIDTDGVDKNEGSDDVAVFGAHLDLLYRFMPEEKLVPYLALGGGGLIIKFDGQSHKVEDFLNYGAGLNYYLDDSLALRFDLRHILTYERDDWGNVGEQSFSAMAGVTFHLQKSSPKVARVDSDDDGIIDALDRCPSSPPGVSVDKNGCAFNQKRIAVGSDSDDDGIMDKNDECPSSPPGVSVDEDGCAFDDDRDGIPDYRDICPGTKADARVNQVGCPEKATADAGN